MRFPSHCHWRDPVRIERHNMSSAELGIVTFLSILIDSQQDEES